MRDREAERYGNAEETASAYLAAKHDAEVADEGLERALELADMHWRQCHATLNRLAERLVPLTGVAFPPAPQNSMAASDRWRSIRPAVTTARLAATTAQDAR